MVTSQKKATQTKRKAAATTAAAAGEKQVVDVGTFLSFLKLDIEVRKRISSKTKIIPVLILLSQYIDDIMGLLL
ncbi:hypothetical protein ACF5W4_11365 [Bacillota bacterium Lsc_1132]